MNKPTAISAAFLVLVNAVVTLLGSLGSIHWTDAQTGLVYVEANAGAALVLALYFHFAPGTKKQPVAIAASVTALAAATCALLTGFAVWSLTDAQNGLVVGTVTAVIGLITAAFAHNAVTAPVTPPVAVPGGNPGGNVLPDGEPLNNPPVPGR